MQAIVTKRLPATNHKPSRVKAFCDAGSIVWSWDHGLGLRENHEAAARALAINLGWLEDGRYRLAGGGMPVATPYSFVFILVLEEPRFALLSDDDSVVLFHDAKEAHDTHKRWIADGANGVMLISLKHE